METFQTRAFLNLSGLRRALLVFLIGVESQKHPSVGYHNLCASNNLIFPFTDCIDMPRLQYLISGRPPSSSLYNNPVSQRYNIIWLVQIAPFRSRASNWTSFKIQNSSVWGWAIYLAQFMSMLRKRNDSCVANVASTSTSCEAVAAMARSQSLAGMTGSSKINGHDSLYRWVLLKNMARMPFTPSPSGNLSEDHNRDSNKPERDRARRRPEKMNACEARWLQSLLESFEEEEEKEDLGPLSFKVLIGASVDPG
ncbi:hypothetical protein B0H14DRAFT_2600822 [Mycena olivaceomarginata]|nr:hypothetical protein B0H14DRAFT_2600822 [Mycena olivaceomarginata]